MLLTLSSGLVLAVTILFTSFVGGVFGMAGGLILMGVLLLYVPVPTAMVLHAITQMTANLWRAFLWRAYVEWRLVLRYALGLLGAVAVFAFIAFVPDRALVLVMLGVISFAGVLVPARWAMRVDRTGGAEVAGFFSTAIQLVSGVSGPLLDLFFVRVVMDRRKVVATKALCQAVTHCAKLIYFGGLVGGARTDPSLLFLLIAVALAALGTSLSRVVLERLTDVQFRLWTRWIIGGLGAICLMQGIAAYARP